MTNEQLIADAKEFGAIVSHYNGTYGNRQEASYKFTEAQLTAFAAIIRKRDKAEIAKRKAFASDLIATNADNGAVIAKLQDDLDKANAEIARLRESLTYYLDEFNGTVARKALAQGEQNE